MSTAHSRYETAHKTWSDPVGVGGWLLFFCLSLTILGPIASAIGIWSNQVAYQMPASQSPAVTQAFMIETWGAILIGILGFVIGCIIWSGSPNGKRLAKVYLVIRLVAFISMEGIAAWSIQSGDAKAFPHALSGAVTPLIREVVFFLVWWGYFAVSHRVRNTYPEEATGEAPIRHDGRIDDAYTRLAKELADGYRHDGLWLRAVTESDGDEAKAKIVYNRLRAEMLAR